MHVFQVEVEKTMFCFLVSALIHKCVFCVVFTFFFFFTLVCIFLVISLFKMALKHSVEVLSGVPMCRKVMMCLVEELFVSNELCSNVSYSVIG